MLLLLCDSSIYKLWKTYSGFGFSPFGIEKFWNSNRTLSKFCESCIPYIKYLEPRQKTILDLKKKLQNTYIFDEKNNCRF